MSPDQLKALHIFHAITRGFCDPWDLMGAQNAGKRQEIMSLLAGKPVSKAKAGVIALREALWDLFPAAKPECLVGRQDDLKKRIMNALYGSMVEKSK